MNSNNRIILLIIIALTLFYLYLTSTHALKVNTNINSGDQNSYISTIVKIYKENYWYFGDRNRMPLYPYLLAIFYKPGLTDEELFYRGKIINIFISIVMLAVIYKASIRYFNSFASYTFIILVAFTFFLFKAGYFQAEVLFYTLYFLTFISFIKNFKNPNTKNGIITGVLVALSYLTKATALLGFIIYIIFQFAKYYIYLVKNKKNKNRLIRSIFSSIIIFLIIVYPYISDTKRFFGRYFYNVNTTFYVWYDSIKEVREGTSYYGDKVGWPKMDVEKIPSLQKYINDHTTQQILKRFETGFFKLILFSFLTYATVPFSFLLIYSFFIIIQGYFRKTQLIKLIINNMELLIFFFTFFITHIIAFSWYAYVDSGPRFTLSLYLPIIFLLFLLYQKLQPANKLSYSNSFNITLLLILFLLMKPFIIPILFTFYSGF